MTATWDQIWESCFYKIPDDQVSVWDEEIDRRIRNATSGDVIEAVRDIAERSRKGDLRRPRGLNGFFPNVNHIISAIIKSRCADKFANQNVQTDQFIGQLKSEIRQAADHLARWNIICDPRYYTRWAQRDTTHEECRELEDWARVEWKDFERPKLRPTMSEVINKW
jgi:hypothetical protein